MKRHLSVQLAVKAANLAFSRILYRPAEWLVHRFSSVGQDRFFDPSEFAWIPRIEADWKAIRDEARALLRERGQIPSFHEIAPGNTPRAMTTDGKWKKWKSYWLYAYGRKFAENCRRCPETTRLIDTIPGIKTAFFSILAPRAHIPEHTGPYGGVLRYHLGLIVPRQKEACRIRVDSDVVHWEEGRSIVFDDTYPHEVWNDTDEERVVLFVDFARPLPFPVSGLNDAVIRLASRSGFVQDIVENVEDWNRQAGAAKTGKLSERDHH
jgi:beta-hydroxylase